MYWFTGSILGGIFGSLIHFNTEGLEFVMTAMFAVIFLEQWLKDKTTPARFLGRTVAAVPCCVQAENFIVPAMLAILGVLTLLRKPLRRR